MDNLFLNEATRGQFIAKSRTADPYKHNIRGQNRFIRKKFSKISNNVQKFNSINMNDLFKKDLLTIVIPVIGETNEYEVTVQIDGVMEEIARNIKANQNKFEFRTVLQALTKRFNVSNIRVKCTCDDFKYTYAHNLIINQNSVDDTSRDPGPGKTGKTADAKSQGCKHILLVLANTAWIMKVTSVITNYINYMNIHKHDLFLKVMFPKLYGVTPDEAIDTNLVPPETNLNTDKDLINTINEWAKNRGKIKPGTQVNPVTGTGGRTRKLNTEEKIKEE